jgi:cytochrome P450
MKEVIQKRIDSGEHRQDILQYLIDTLKAESADDRLNVDDIINEVVLFLIAGSETTSNTTGFLFLEMLRNPGAFEKLQREVEDINLEDGHVIFKHSQVKTLPYLNASIDEALRMHPANPGSMPRKVISDIVLGGKLFIPKDVGATFFQ